MLEAVTETFAVDFRNILISVKLYDILKVVQISNRCSPL